MSASGVCFRFVRIGFRWKKRLWRENLLSKWSKDRYDKMYIYRLIEKYWKQNWKQCEFLNEFDGKHFSRMICFKILKMLNLIIAMYVQAMHKLIYSIYPSWKHFYEQMYYLDDEAGFFSLFLSLIFLRVNWFKLICPCFQITSVEAWIMVFEWMIFIQMKLRNLIRFIMTQLLRFCRISVWEGHCFCG